MTFLQKVERANSIIKDSLDKYPNSAIAVSFGKDSMVLLDLMRRIKKDILVFAVLSDTEFDETNTFKNKVVEEWDLNYKQYDFKNPENIEKCCQTEKVDKFKEAVLNLDAWFSAIRRDEGITRVEFEEVEEKDGLIKINPILDFTEKDIWRYTSLYDVPVNPVYKRGYRSLSCERCSEIEKDENESERAGRWKGTKNEGGECGIHTKSLR